MIIYCPLQNLNCPVLSAPFSPTTLSLSLPRNVHPNERVFDRTAVSTSRRRQGHVLGVHEHINHGEKMVCVHHSSPQAARCTNTATYYVRQLCTRTYGRARGMLYGTRVKASFLFLGHCRIPLLSNRVSTPYIFTAQSLSNTPSIEF